MEAEGGKNRRPVEGVTRLRENARAERVRQRRAKDREKEGDRKRVIEKFEVSGWPGQECLDDDWRGK
jgi:hypothetical protein